MAAINGYTTLADVKSLLKIEADDFADDAVIDSLIEQASRFCDDTTGRTFYPRIETHSFDVPDGRSIWFDDDLLAVISVTNGDATAITSGYYILHPANVYPKYAISLIESTSLYWEVDSNQDAEQAIDIAAWWGFRQQYTQRAWVLGTTLNEGGVLNATDTTFTVTSRSKFKIGQVIKIESEMMIVSGLNASDITVMARGDNGSTAATHADGSSVYIWTPEPDIVLATHLICKNFYHNRFGQNTTATATITAAGVVLAPEDIPASALKILAKYTRIVP